MTNQSTRAEIIKNGVTRDGMVELAVTHSFGDPDIERRLWMFLADCLAHVIERCDIRINLDSARDAVRDMRKRAGEDLTDKQLLDRTRGILHDLSTLGHPDSQYITALAAQMTMWNLFHDAWSSYNMIACLARCGEVLVRWEAWKGIATVGHRQTYGDIATEEMRWQEVRLTAWLRDDEPEPIPVR